MTNINLSHIKSAYMIGIGGIGMSAIARYLSSEGIRVSGYDSTPSQLAQRLMDEGMSIHFTDDVSQIDPKADIVIYSPAVPKNHGELSYYRENGFPVMKRSEALGMIARNRKNICVAGTHGKTTTSTIIAYLLRETGIGGSAFLGGISMNYNVNFWNLSNEPCVIEADEYDRSFLQLFPDIAVISSMDADHLDIYGNERAMQESYVQFSNQIKSGGILFYKLGIHRANDLAPHIGDRFSYDVSAKDAYLRASDIRIENGAYHFTAHIGGYEIDNLRLQMGGRYNIENALVGIAVAHMYKADDSAIRKALSNFKGIERRFNIYRVSDACVLVDDYAHHPKELRSLLQGVKELFPGRDIVTVFQPHLFSRTKDFASEFSAALSESDRVYLLDIYPARELPMEGVTSDMLLKNITLREKKVIKKEELISEIRALDKSAPKAIVIAGAGNIADIVKPLYNALKEND